MTTDPGLPMITDIALLKRDADTLKETLKRIEGKLDKVTDDHEIRLRNLEAKMASSDKLWATVAIVVSTLLSFGMVVVSSQLVK